MNHNNEIGQNIEYVNWKGRIKDRSYYFRTSQILNSKTKMQFLNLNGIVKYLSDSEADDLSRVIKKNNLFQRIPTSQQSYVIRAKEFSNSTVIEINSPDQNPDCLIEKANITSNWIEIICLLSYSMAHNRNNIHRLLKIRDNIDSDNYLAVTTNCRYLRTKNYENATSKGILIDDNFISRYKKNGFRELESVCFTDNDILKRVEKSAKWIFESRTESNLQSAIVKTTIAIESLLIFSDSESISQNLSERIAFLITTDLSIRKKISSYVKKLYAARSGIVHGGSKKMKFVTPDILEGFDRIVILTYITIVYNQNKWRNIEELQRWFDDERFGNTDKTIKHPFSKSYLNNAIKLIEKNIPPESYS